MLAAITEVLIIFCSDHMETSQRILYAVLSMEDPEGIGSNAPDCVVLCIPNTIDLFSQGDLFSHSEDTLVFKFSNKDLCMNE